jgi:hypothetical protein
LKGQAVGQVQGAAKVVETFPILVFWDLGTAKASFLFTVLVLHFC